MKLIIVPTTELRRELLEHNGPFEMGVAEFPSWLAEDFENYGQVWAKCWKTDIVMITEDD